MTHTAFDPVPTLPAGLAPLPGRAPGKAGHVLAALPDTVQAVIAPVAGFLDTVFAAAPYLARLAQRRPDTLMACASETPDRLMTMAISRSGVSLDRKSTL